MIQQIPIQRWGVLVSGLVSLLLVGSSCNSTSWTIDLSPKATPVTPSLEPSITYPGWTELQVGVDYKQQMVKLDNTKELIHLVRIDQTKADLLVAVAENMPRPVSAWAKQLQASVVVNGSYFDEQYQLVTRTNVAGEQYGSLLSGNTGVAQRTETGLWAITAWTGEAITADFAIQSYPLLLNQGAVNFTAGSDATAQRTIVAQDSAGFMYLLVCEYGGLTLADLAKVLAEQVALPDLTALNLDGATSTGLVITSSAVQFSDDSLAVPSVLYILPPNDL